MYHENFYSHAPRGARRMKIVIGITPITISTHTPLAGRDHAQGNYGTAVGISTHTPLAGRDVYAADVTPAYSNFYSHAPRGARQAAQISALILQDFYSHAPRGARQKILPGYCAQSRFLLTRPSRGATGQVRRAEHHKKISTHTPSRGATATYWFFIAAIPISSARKRKN